jgi:hypothetical protein
VIFRIGLVQFSPDILRKGAGLNSTPGLIGMIMFIICSQLLHVSYNRTNRRRDKKGKVSRMRSMRIKIGGRGLAAPLVSAGAASIGLAGFGGGSG